MESSRQSEPRARATAPETEAPTARKATKTSEPPPKDTEPLKPKPISTKPDESPKEESPAPTDDWTEFSRGNPESPRIALTFDAGWENKPGDKILDVLAKHHVRSTFFLTGRWVEKNPDLTRRISSEGHEIGNHTWSHKRLTKLSAAQITEETDKAEKIIVNLTSKSTKPLLRVPYGERDKRVLSTLAKLGYRSIYWDEDCWDSVKPNVTPAEIEARVTAKTRNGSVVLMHIGSEATANALDSILEKLQAAGFQPVTVGELLNN